jgi:hypothetical protein
MLRRAHSTLLVTTQGFSPWAAEGCQQQHLPEGSVLGDNWRIRHGAASVIMDRVENVPTRPTSPVIARYCSALKPLF